MIDQFLYDEFRKDHAVVEKLRGCVSQIHAQKANKIRWSCEENVEAAMVEQQQQRQVVQGASSSSTMVPHLDQFQMSFEENVAANAGG